MKATNKYNNDVTKAVILLLENKITSKEFQEMIKKKEEDKFKEFDKWFNKLAKKNGTTKY